MPEIYSPKDWSHEEQLKHIMSVSAAYPPGTKVPFDWFGFWLFAIPILCILLGIGIGVVLAI